MWRFQIPALAERHRVIDVDGPGHGRSEPIRRPFTMEECAEAGVEIMDALGIERAHWGGLSWGGMTGMRLALRHPSRVRSLALLDTSAAPEDPKKLPSYRVMSFLASTVGPFPKLLDRLEPIFFADRTRREERGVVEDFRDQLVRMDPTSIERSVDAVIFRRDDIRDQLERIDAPTLVLVGAEDVATPPARAYEIAEHIAGARLVEIPGAAHLSTLDQPERVTQALLEHLARA